MQPVVRPPPVNLDTTPPLKSILDNPKSNILEIGKLTRLLPITFRHFRDSPRLKPNPADLSPLEHLTFDGRDNA